MRGIDERDESGGAVEAEASLLIVRSGTRARKIVHDRLNFLIGAARQRSKPAGEQLKNVPGDGVIEGRDPFGEHLAHDLGRGHGFAGTRDDFVERLLDDDGEVVRRVLNGGISEVALVTRHVRLFVSTAS